MNPKIPGMANRIEMWDVEKLRPYARNARTHSDEQISQIAASFLRFGMVNPLLVDTDAGLIAGHGRLEAAKLIGMKEVPVIVLDHLTEDQKRAYIIADNKLAENAGWDKELLKIEMEYLIEHEFNPAEIGFKQEEIDDILKKVEEELTDGFDDDEDEGELEEADTICVVGSYRILIDRDDYLKWHDAIREKVGFEKDAIKDEIRKRLKI